MDHQAPEFVSEVGAPQWQNVEQDEGNATSTQPAVDAHEDSPEDSHEDSAQDVMQSDDVHQSLEARPATRTKLCDNIEWNGQSGEAKPFFCICKKCSGVIYVDKYLTHIKACVGKVAENEHPEDVKEGDVNVCEGENSVTKLYQNVRAAQPETNDSQDISLDEEGTSTTETNVTKLCKDEDAGQDGEMSKCTDLVTTNEEEDPPIDLIPKNNELVHQMIKSQEHSKSQTLTHGKTSLKVYCENLAGKYRIIDEEVSEVRLKVEEDIKVDARAETASMSDDRVASMQIEPTPRQNSDIQTDSCVKEDAEVEAKTDTGKVEVGRGRKRTREDEQDEIRLCRFRGCKKYTSVAQVLDFNSDGYLMDSPDKFNPDNYPQIMKTRKKCVTPPDPRPLFGCTWCGPKVQPDQEHLIQIKGDVCPACQYFADHGWDRVNLTQAVKITFTTPDSRSLRNVKSFLQESSKILSKMLGGSKDDSLVQTKDIETPREECVKRSSRVKVPIQFFDASERTRRRRRRKPPEKLDTGVENSIKEEIQSTSKRKVESSMTDKFPHLPWAQRHLTRYKKFVSTKDPRPIFGCVWCCPSLFEHGHTSNEGGICDTCQIFSNNGMTRVDARQTAKHVYFYDGDGKIKYSSTLQFLKATSEFLFSKTDEVGGSFKAGKEAGNGTVEKGLCKEEISIPDWGVKCIEARKQYVNKLDKRPTFGCTWCGPKMKGEDVVPVLLDGDICPSCKLIEDSGWTMKSYDTARHFYNKAGKDYSGVKTYLKVSTKIVAKMMKAMSSSDIKALEPRYQVPDKSFGTKSQISRKSKIQMLQSETRKAATPKSMGSKRSSDDLPPPPKKITSVALPTIAELLGKEKGLVGVLQADVHQVYNVHFGSNANIAAKILLCLGKGKIPPCVLEETPFQRLPVQSLDSDTSEAVSTQYMGVVMMDKTNTNHNEYGVAIPLFYVDSKRLQESSIKYKTKDYIIPRESKVNGQTLLLRVGIEDEKIAGQFFAFMYRIMYGSQMVASVLADYNTPKPDSISQASEPNTNGPSMPPQPNTEKDTAVTAGGEESCILS